MGSQREDLPENLPRLPYAGSEWSDLRDEVTVGELLAPGEGPPEFSDMDVGMAIGAVVGALSAPPELPDRFEGCSVGDIRAVSIGECSTRDLAAATSPADRDEIRREIQETLYLLLAWVRHQEGELEEFRSDAGGD